MKPEQRQQFLALHTKLDQLLAEADDIKSEPLTAEIDAMCDDFRETLAAMLAKVEERLDDHE